MSIFFTSDHHFGHVNIIRLADRPFVDRVAKGKPTVPAVEVMREIMVRRWNEVVSPTDHVYHMGDFALGKIDESLEVVKELNGVKTLIVGNHDRNFRGGRRSAGLEPHEWDQRYIDAGFTAVEQRLALVGFADMEPVSLSHFPYTGDHFDGDRFEEFRMVDSGLPIVHGHTHSKTAITYSQRGTLQISVGVDTWDFRPVGYDQITAIIRSLRQR